MGSRGDFPHGPAEGLRGIRGYHEAPPGLEEHTVGGYRLLPISADDDARIGTGENGAAAMGWPAAVVNCALLLSISLQTGRVRLISRQISHARSDPPAGEGVWVDA